MSCKNNCGCGIRSMNYRPIRTTAEDCFFMQKVTQAFSGSFNNLAVTMTLNLPTPVPPAPYTFVSARSQADYATVGSIKEISPSAVLREALGAAIPDLPAQRIHTYQVAVTVYVEITYKDNAGAQHVAGGPLDLVLDVRTPLTYEMLSDLGIPTVLAGFDAINGSFTTGTTVKMTLCGNADLLYLFPMLLKMQFSGECAFMPACDESMTVKTADAPTVITVNT